MLRILFFLTVFCSFAQANNVGFSKGNQLTATPIQGQVTVICNGFNGSDSAAYSCRDVALDPQAYDYFIGPQVYRGDKVELVAQHEDGSTRSRVFNYDGARGRSRDLVNLWVSNFFQKPLLEFGVNTIRFKIYEGTNNIQPFGEGTFQAVVRKGTSRTCPNAQYNSLDVNDCNSPYSICQRYFEEYRNCQ